MYFRESPKIAIKNQIVNKILPPLSIKFFKNFQKSPCFFGKADLYFISTL
jgi:hypothetical protein